LEEEIAASASAWRRARSATLVALFLGFAGAAAGEPAQSLATPGDTGYRTPSDAVVGLLTATPPPAPLLHAGSRQIALLCTRRCSTCARSASTR
jgi:hypothetical protein